MKQLFLIFQNVISAEKIDFLDLEKSSYYGYNFFQPFNRKKFKTEVRFWNDFSIS